MNIPIFIPELACPHQCVFCNQEKISGAEKIPQPWDIKAIVENYLQSIPENREVQIAFFGGSFTGIPIPVQEQYLKAAYQFVASGKVSGIRLSTRPDYVNNKILDLLKNYGVSVIELGAQSTNNEVLHKSGRGHSFQHIIKATERIHNYGFELGLQMMIGLPYDSYERAILTAKDIVRLGAQNTRIYPTLVVAGTALEKLYRQGKYTPLSLNEAVLWTKDILKIFMLNNVSVIRVGLHPSKELVQGKSLVSGPWHPAFKELVLTKIWNDIILAHIKPDTSKRINIIVSEKQLSYAIGYKQKNKIQLADKGFAVEFSSDANLKDFQINFVDRRNE